MPISPETKLIEIGTLAQWAAASATFLAVLVALFKDEFLRWKRKPNLRLSVSLTPPDCHKTIVTYLDQTTTPTLGTVDCYYLRLWIENAGKTRVERAQVFVAKLSRRSADGSFKDVDQFLPMNLRWSHAGSRAPEIFAEGISPEMGRHCDLGHVVNPTFRKNCGYDLSTVSDADTVLALDLEIQPNTRSHLVPPSVYHLTLRVAAANCPPSTHVLELTLTGKWFDDESRMFADGLGLKLLTS